MGLNNSAILKRIFLAGLKAVNGSAAVRHVIRQDKAGITICGTCYSYAHFNRIFVIGAGKASFDMAKALDGTMGGHIDNGIIITKYGYGGTLKHIKTIEAGHPLPDLNGVKATQQLLSLAGSVNRHTLVLMLLSGGASSLLVAPDGISLKDKIRTTSLLLRSGAGIDELNSVRKQLSLVKGGRLADVFYPAKMVTLIISDVIGNRLETIGSGPTVKDASTPDQAMEIINLYRLSDKIPGAVLRRLEQKKNNYHRPSISPHVKNVIIADNKKAAAACTTEALRLGLKPFILTTSLHGEAREAGHVLASIADEMARNKKSQDKRICIISSGETTVTVKGTGRGGRNQELALSFAIDIQRKKSINLLSAGTDGTDGPTDAAGAIVDGTTAARIKTMGLDPYKYILNNDSYTILEKAECLLKTGPTGTNVMDIQLILIG